MGLIKLDSGKNLPRDKAESNIKTSEGTVPICTYIQKSGSNKNDFSLSHTPSVMAVLVPYSKENEQFANAKVVYEHELKPLEALYPANEIQALRNEYERMTREPVIVEMENPDRSDVPKTLTDINLGRNLYHIEEFRNYVISLDRPKDAPPVRRPRSTSTSNMLLPLFDFDKTQFDGVNPENHAKSFTAAHAKLFTDSASVTKRNEDRLAPTPVTRETLTKELFKQAFQNLADQLMTQRNLTFHLLYCPKRDDVLRQAARVRFTHHLFRNKGVTLDNFRSFWHYLVYCKRWKICWKRVKSILFFEYALVPLGTLPTFQSAVTGYNKLAQDHGLDASNSWSATKKYEAKKEDSPEQATKVSMNFKALLKAMKHRTFRAPQEKVKSKS